MSIDHSRDGDAGASCATDLAESFACGRAMQAHGHGARVFDLAFHPTQPGLLVSASDDNTVAVWREHPGGGGSAGRRGGGGGRAAGAPSRYKQTASFVGHRDSVMRVNWAPDGDLLASGSADGTVQLWRLAAAAAASPRDLGPAGTRHAATLGGHPEEVYACMFLQREAHSAAAPSRLISASGESLFLWDVAAAALLQKAGPPPAPPAAAVPERWRQGCLFGIAAQPDGPLVAAACSDGNLRLWSAEGGGAALLPLCTLPWNQAMGSDCAFGPGQELAAVSQDGSLIVMDLRRGGQLLQHISLGVPLLSCELLAGGTGGGGAQGPGSPAGGGGGLCVVAAGADGSVYFVDVATGDVASLQPDVLPGRPLLAAAVAARGRRRQGGVVIVLGAVQVLLKCWHLEKNGNK